MYEFDHHYLSKKGFSIGVCTQESSFKNIEVDTLILSNSLLVAQPKVDHCQLCVFFIFLQFTLFDKLRSSRTTIIEAHLNQ